MSNNDNNIEKRSFEAFVNAIGSEIEQAQVRLISAANAQMLFHYWKMGNYILYHQNRQGWGGKVIKKLAQAIRFNYPEKKGYSVRNLAYMCQFARSYPLTVLRSFIETDAKLLTPSVQKITDELQSLNNMTFTQEPLAQIQSSDNKEIARGCVKTLAQPLLYFKFCYIFFWLCYFFLMHLAASCYIPIISGYK